MLSVHSNVVVVALYIRFPPLLLSGTFVLLRGRAHFVLLLMLLPGWRHSCRVGGLCLRQHKFLEGNQNNDHFSQLSWTTSKGRWYFLKNIVYGEPID